MAHAESERPDHSRLLQHPWGRRALAAFMLAIAVVLAGHSLKIDLAYWPYDNFLRSRGDLVRLLEQINQVRLMSFYIGIAGRDAAGGPVTEMIGPPSFAQLAEVPRPENALNPYSSYYLLQMSSMGFKSEDYDPVLAEDTLQRLLGTYETAEYPMKVVAVIGDSPDGSVMLFTDEAREKLYVLSTGIVPEEVRP